MSLLCECHVTASESVIVTSCRLLPCLAAVLLVEAINSFTHMKRLVPKHLAQAKQCDPRDCVTVTDSLVRPGSECQ